MARSNPVRLVRRATTGVVVIVAAFLVSMFMNGPGAGDGDGDSITSSGSDDLQASASVEDALLVSSDQPDGLTDDEQAALSGNTLHILIDEFSYLMRVPGQQTDSWQAIELDRLTEVAQQAAGDTNGIRVRIQKRVTARASAEQEILQQLNASGIGSDAIFESPELVE